MEDGGHYLFRVLSWSLLGVLRKTTKTQGTRNADLGLDPESCKYKC